jgi:hypothetical protein
VREVVSSLTCRGQLTSREPPGSGLDAGRVLRDDEASKAHKYNDLQGKCAVGRKVKW